MDVYKCIHNIYKARVNNIISSNKFYMDMNHFINKYCKIDCLSVTWGLTSLADLKISYYLYNEQIFDIIIFKNNLLKPHSYSDNTIFIPSHNENNYGMNNLNINYKNKEIIIDFLNFHEIFKLSDINCFEFELYFKRLLYQNDIYNDINYITIIKEMFLLSNNLLYISTIDVECLFSKLILNDVENIDILNMMIENFFSVFNKKINFNTEYKYE